uniref:Uncharacterized protein n=1 Tax=Solanum tuberosum TaxID=4113 RepID=M1DMX9_SOLTU
MDNLAREFPQILRRIRELHMEFIFAEPGECNLHVVREFYAWAPDARSHFMTVWGVNVLITPADVERRYPLNAHAKALLDIGPVFRDPIDDDIPTDEDRLCTSSDVESDSDEEVDPDQADVEAEGGDAMDD